MKTLTTSQDCYDALNEAQDCILDVERAYKKLHPSLQLGEIREGQDQAMKAVLLARDMLMTALHEMDSFSRW